MAKLVVNDISSGYASTTALNTAFTAIETALENTLSRDGTSPNSMSANLDMNGYAILNARATSGNENFIWLGTWTTGASYAVNNLVYAPEGSNLGNTLICVTANTAGATLDGDASKWAVFAQRGAAGAGTGDVVGPASSTADSLVRYNGTTGKLIKDGAVVGVDIMAYDAGLAATTAFAKTLLNDASATDARTTLGLGTAAVLNTGVAEGDLPLIDYGTFTPSITFATAGNLSIVYSNQLGRYIKLGRLIIADIYMTTSTFTHTTAAGGLQVTGFPVASENVSVYSSTGSISWQGITKAGYTSIAAVMAANTSTCVFVASGSGVAVSDVAAADMPTGGNVILRFTISYLAAT